ncbi:MAG: hypothetical protein JO127_07760 [Caulobacteraceae bacterium]|nr:hypothetical protein [Caulobacteraceae bacterium]
MRIRPWLVCLSATAALAACQPPSPQPTAARVALPRQTPLASGYWVQRVSDHRRVFVTRYCLDDASAQLLAAFGRTLASRCASQNVAQAADRSWRFATRCDLGGGGLAADGVARGDFTRHYVVEAQTESIPGGAHRVLADVSLLGPCPADLKPGDIVWPNGRRSRLSELAGPS